MKKPKASSSFNGLCNRNKLGIKFIKVTSPNLTVVKSNESRLSQIEEILGCAGRSETNLIKETKDTLARRPNPTANQRVLVSKTRTTKSNNHDRQSQCYSPSILPSNLETFDLPKKNDTSQNYRSSSSNSTFFEVNSSHRISSLETIYLSDSSEGAIFDSSGQLTSSNTWTSEIKRVNKKSNSTSKSTRKKTTVRKMTNRKPYSVKRESQSQCTNLAKSDPSSRHNTSSKELFSSDADKSILLNDSLFVRSPSVVLPSPENEPPKRRNTPAKKISSVGENSASDFTKLLRYPLRNLTTLSPVIYDLPKYSSNETKNSYMVASTSKPKNAATKKVLTPKFEKCDRYKMASKFQLLHYDFIQDSLDETDIEIYDYAPSSTKASKKTSKSNSNRFSGIMTSKPTSSRPNKTAPKSTSACSSQTATKSKNGSHRQTPLIENTQKKIGHSITLSPLSIENSQDKTELSLEAGSEIYELVHSPKQVPKKCRPRKTLVKRNNDCSQRTPLSQNATSKVHPKKTNRSAKKPSQQCDDSFGNLLNNLSVTSLASVLDCVTSSNTQSDSRSRKPTSKKKINRNQRNNSLQSEAITSRKNNESSAEVFPILNEDSSENIFDTSTNTPMDVYDYVPDSSTSIRHREREISKRKNDSNQETPASQRIAKLNAIKKIADINSPANASTLNSNIFSPKVIERCNKVISQPKKIEKCKTKKPTGQSRFPNLFSNNMEKSHVLKDMKNTPDMMKNRRNFRNNSSISEDSSQKSQRNVKTLQNSAQIDPIFRPIAISSPLTNNYAFKCNQNYRRHYPYGNLLAYIDNMNYNNNDADIQELCQLFGRLKIADKNTISPTTSFFRYREPSYNANKIYAGKSENLRKPKEIRLKKSKLSFSQPTSSNFLKKIGSPFLSVIFRPQDEPAGGKTEDLKSNFPASSNEIGSADVMDAFNVNISVRPFLQEITHIERRIPHFFHRNGNEEYDLNGLIDWN